MPAKGVVESSAKGDGRFQEDIYFGDPYREAEERIAKERAWNEVVWEEERAARDAERIRLEIERRKRPLAIEAGPISFTTCQALELWPSIVHDVNGYYRELGVWVKATRRQIRRAYQENGGADSERLTYIVKQLLNPSIRRRYDACQPGSIFFDKYVAEEVKRKMLEDQMKENGRILTFDDRAEDMDEIDLSTYMGRQWDDAAGEWADELSELDFSDSVRRFRWRWGYYLWDTEIYDTDRLQEWQEALLQAAAYLQEVIEISVGLVGGSAEEPVRVERIGYRCVVFLGHSQIPTAGLAEQAIRRVVNQQIHEIGAKHG